MKFRKSTSAFGLLGFLWLKENPKKKFFFFFYSTLFSIYLFPMILFSTEKSGSNIHTKIPWLNFSPNPNINKRFTCRRSVSTSASSYRRCSVRKDVLKNFGNFTGKNLCWSLFLMKLQGFGQVFSCEFCKILKKTFLHDTSRRVLLVWHIYSSVEVSGSKWRNYSNYRCYHCTKNYVFH